MPPPSLVRSPARRTPAASSSLGCCPETGSPRAARDRESKSGQSGLWTWKRFQFLVIPGRGQRVGAFAPPDDRLCLEPGISRFPVHAKGACPGITIGEVSLVSRPCFAQL